MVCSTVHDPVHDPELYPETGEEYELQPYQLPRESPNLGPESETYSAPSPPPASESHTESDDQGDLAFGDPGTAVLFPNNPEIAYPLCNNFAPSPESNAHRDTVMNDLFPAEEAKEKLPESSRAAGDPTESGETPAAPKSINVDANHLKAQAAAGLREHEASQAHHDVRERALEARHDSAHDTVPQISPDQRPPRSGHASPLRIKTEAPVSLIDNTSITSPTLRKHVIQVAEGTAGTLPALQPKSPAKDGSASSPQTGKLPPIHQLTSQLGPLGELAEAATQQDPRGQTSHHQHSHSFGSAASQSPMIPYHPHSYPYPYPSSAQTSPSSHYGYSARSPTSTIGDHVYGSPTQYPNPAYYPARRTSAPTENGLPHPPSLPSTSSSGDSHGPPSSTTDGYSTAHTTPIDGPPAAECTSRLILPPPRGMSQSAVIMSTVFKCDFPGCTAIPFQTQYLLRCAILAEHVTDFANDIVAHIGTFIAKRDHTTVRRKGVLAATEAKVSNARTK